jgi:hypothetical protein
MAGKKEKDKDSVNVNVNDKNKIDSVIIESLHVDDEGVKIVKSFSMEKIKSLGVSDISSFLQGCLDAENGREFSDSSEDYINGYKYATTGQF